VFATVLIAGSCARGASGDSTAADVSGGAPMRPDSSELADPFQGRYLDETPGVREVDLTYLSENHPDLQSLGSDSDLVFVGTLVGSSADVAETKMIDEPGIEEQTMLVWDSLEFRVERVLNGAMGGETVSIGHPAFIRYTEGLARLTLEPIELLRSELQAKVGSKRWLVFAKRDIDSGLLSISRGRLIRIDQNGFVAAGSVGLLANVTPDNGFATTIDDIDAHLNGGAPLPKPRAPDLTREELERLHVPSGELLVEPQPGPDPLSPCEGLTGTALAEAEQNNLC